MNILNISKAAQYLKLSVGHLQRLDREGKLKAHRTLTNRRYYTQEDLEKFLHKDFSKNKKDIVYCRVSSSNQKQDLKNQRNILEQYCLNLGINNPEFIEEIGGGLNFTRPKFNLLMKEVEQFLVSKIIIAHKDRLCRFGFEWFEIFCNDHGCEIIILNQEKLSPQEEMVNDLMTIIHCFSSRLYGLRNYKKKIKEVVSVDFNSQNENLSQ